MNLSYKKEDTQENNYQGYFLFLLAGVFIFRLSFLILAPLDLSPDEAYYWDWSRHLDWGYYSKPPLVAWIIAFFTNILGNNEFGVRFPALIFSTIDMIVIYLMGKRIFSERAGFWAAATSAAMPGTTVLSLIMTIDAPLVCFWTLAFYSLWMAAEPYLTSIEDRRHQRGIFWWIITGITSGLGLISKQTMAGFWPLAFMFLLLFPTGRKTLRTPWPYISVTICILFLAPVVFWNWQHDWITVQHTAHHFHSDGSTPLSWLKTSSDFLISQLAVISPFTWTLAMLLCGCVLFRFRKMMPAQVYLAVMCMPAIAGIMLLSLKQRINANWPAPFYISSIVLLAGWAKTRLSCSKGLDRMKSLFVPGVIVGFVMTATLYTVVAFGPQLPLDPAERIRGWEKFGTEVGETIASLPRKDKTFLLAKKRQIVSELAFYVDGQPVVYRWHDRSKGIRTQYEIWSPPMDKLGWDAVLVLKKGRGIPHGINNAFTKISHIKDIEVQIGRGRSRNFSLYLCEQLVSWPGVS